VNGCNRLPFCSERLLKPHHLKAVNVLHEAGSRVTVTAHLANGEQQIFEMGLWLLARYCWAARMASVVVH